MENKIFFDKYLLYKKKYLGLYNQKGSAPIDSKLKINKCISSSNTIEEYVEKVTPKILLENLNEETLSSGEKQNLRNLNKKINDNHRIIIDELNKHLKKEGHWIWYAFPTEKEGFSESSPKTHVTKKLAPFLFKNENFMSIHKVLHELLQMQLDRECKLDLFPSIDIGRIKYFIKLWNDENILKYTDDYFFKSNLELYDRYIIRFFNENPSFKID